MAPVYLSRRDKSAALVSPSPWRLPQLWLSLNPTRQAHLRPTTRTRATLLSMNRIRAPNPSKDAVPLILSASPARGLAHRMSHGHHSALLTKARGARRIEAMRPVATGGRGGDRSQQFRSDSFRVRVADRTDCCQRRMRRPKLVGRFTP